MIDQTVGPEWFREICAGYLRWLARKGRRPNTLIAYQAELQPLGRWLEREAITSADQLTGQHIEDHLEELLEQRSRPGTPRQGRAEGSLCPRAGLSTAISDVSRRLGLLRASASFSLRSYDRTLSQSPTAGRTSAPARSWRGRSKSPRPPCGALCVGQRPRNPRCVHRRSGSVSQPPAAASCSQSRSPKRTSRGSLLP